MIDVDGVPMHADLKQQLVSAKLLREHPDNPRRGQVEKIAESVTENGLYRSIVVQRSTGYILSGNHTFRAVVAKGARQVPVTYVDVDDDRARRILLADNRTSELGDFDEVNLLELLNELDSTGNLDGTGYTSYDLDDLATDLQRLAPPVTRLELIAEDEEDEEPADPATLRRKFTADVQRIDPNRRIIVLDLPMDRFVWLVDRLKLICDERQLETNQDAVLYLAESYVSP